MKRGRLDVCPACMWDDCKNCHDGECPCLHLDTEQRVA